MNRLAQVNTRAHEAGTIPAVSRHPRPPEGIPANHCGAMAIPYTHRISTANPKACPQEILPPLLFPPCPTRESLPISFHRKGSSETERTQRPRGRIGRKVLRNRNAGKALGEAGRIVRNSQNSAIRAASRKGRRGCRWPSGRKQWRRLFGAGAFGPRPSGQSSGRRQDVPQGTMRRPRLSTWRLFPCRIHEYFPSISPANDPRQMTRK